MKYLKQIDNSHYYRIPEKNVDGDQDVIHICVPDLINKLSMHTFESNNERGPLVEIESEEFNWQLRKTLSVLRIVPFTSKALNLVHKEFVRSHTEEPWDIANDDLHKEGELAQAAIAYLHGYNLRYNRGMTDLYDHMREPQYGKDLWPHNWEQEHYKPTPDDPKKQLVKALNLGISELERLIRLENKHADTERTTN